MRGATLKAFGVLFLLLGSIVLYANVTLRSRYLSGDPAGSGRHAPPGLVAARMGTNAVPFYVYDDPIFQELGEGCVEAGMVPMHMADAYWLRAIKSHPWRVDDPEEATLFVLPLCAACHLRKKCRHRFSGVLQKLTVFLDKSEYFHRNYGHDHVLVCTDWNINLRSVWRSGPKLRNLTVPHKGYFSHVAYRCSVPTPFTVNPFIQPMMRERLEAYQKTATWKPMIEVPTSPLSATRLQMLDEMTAGGPFPKIVRLSERPYRLFFMGKLKRPAKDRKIAFQSLPGKFPPSVLISTDIATFKQCDFNDTTGQGLNGCSLVGKHKPMFAEYISSSKFNLHMEGDDYHSSRLADAVAAGTPTIIISNKLWTRGLPNSCQVPWQKMAIGIRPAEFKTGPDVHINKALSVIEGLPEASYAQYQTDIGDEWNAAPQGEAPVSAEEMADLLDRHAPDVLWEAPNSRVASHVLTNSARRCLPPELLRSQGYSANHFQCEYPDLYDPEAYAKPAKVKLTLEKRH